MRILWTLPLCCLHYLCDLLQVVNLEAELLWKLDWDEADSFSHILQWESLWLGLTSAMVISVPHHASTENIVHDSLQDFFSWQFTYLLSTLSLSDAKDYRITRAGKDLQVHPVQQSTCYQYFPTMSLSTTSKHSWNTSRDNDSTKDSDSFTSLGSLFQRLITLL